MYSLSVSNAKFVCFIKLLCLRSDVQILECYHDRQYIFTIDLLRWIIGLIILPVFRQYYLVFHIYCIAIEENMRQSTFRDVLRNKSSD